MNTSDLSSPTLSAVVFDWGGTLMEVYPEYDGPMVNWPKVGVVPGAEQALQALSAAGLQLYVATNAAASTTAQVRAALKRAGIDSYFTQVFTFQDLGHRKPERAFYDTLAQKTGASPSALWMVGDEYRPDVWGSSAAGWRSIWFNPGFQPAPGLLPVQSAEVDRMENLPAALLGNRLPTLTECLDWLLSEGAGLRLLQHVQGTAAVAYFLALRMKSRGLQVDPILAHRGGLLHDLAKIKSIVEPQPGLHHGELAARLLEGRNQPLLAETARRHMLFDILDRQARPQTWEQKLVFFADKLMEGSQLVPLQKRLEALQERYRLDPKKIEAIQPALAALQDEISAALGLPAESWFADLESAFWGARAKPTSA